MTLRECRALRWVLIFAHVMASPCSARADIGPLWSWALTRVERVARADGAAHTHWDHTGVEVSGEVSIDEDVGVFVEAYPLRILRIVAHPGDVEPALRVLRFSSSVGERVMVEERPQRIARGEYLIRAFGSRTSFIIFSEGPARVRVERPVEHRGRLLFENIEEGVWRWITENTPLPNFPASAIEAREVLEADATLVDAVESVVPREASVAFRRAAALRALDLSRPLVSPFYDVDERQGERFRLFGESPMTRHVRGPAVLEIQYRASEEPEGTFSGRSLRVRRRGQTIMSQPLRAPVRDIAPRTSQVTTASGLESVSDSSRTAPLRIERVFVPPGAHEIELEIIGGPTWVRTRVARRRPRLSQWITREEDMSAELRAAHRALEEHPTFMRTTDDPGIRGALARVFLRALAELEGDSGPCRVEDVRLLEDAGAPLFALDASLCAYREEPSDERRSSMVRITSDAIRSPSALSRRLVLRVVAELRDTHAVLLRALLDAVEDAHLIAALTQVDSTLVSSSSLARLQRRHILEPLNSHFYRGLRATARRRRHWRRAPEEGGARGIRAIARSRSPGRGALVLLEEGVEREIELPVSAYDTRRPALLRIWMENDRTRQLGIVIDGRVFRAVQTAGFVAWEFALRSGPHRVRWMGSPHVWLEASSREEMTHGHVRWLHEVAPSDSVGFALGQEASASQPTHVRIELRLPESEGAGAIVARFGDGTERVIHVRAAERDAQLMSERGALSSPVYVNLEVPEGVRELRLASNSLRAFVAVHELGEASSRDAPEDAIEDPSRIRGPELDDPIARIAAATRELESERRNPEACLARVDALLALHEPRLAAIELMRAESLARRGDPRLVGARRRVHGYREETHVEWTGALEEPTPLAPASLAFETEPSQESIAACEDGPPRPEDVHGRAMFAECLTSAGRVDEAARIWLSLYHDSQQWSAGARALELVSRAIETGADGTGLASVAYGFSDELLRRFATAELRAAARRIAGRSRWVSVGPESSAGFERVELADATSSTGREALGRALVPLAGSHESARVLRPGERVSYVLHDAEVSGARLALGCGGVVSDGATTCSYRIRIDGTLISRPNVVVERSTTVPLAIGAGEHRVDVELDGGTSRELLFGAVALEVHTPTGVQSRSVRSLRMYAASSQEEAVFLVQGPTTVRLELRSVVGTGAEEVEVAIESTTGAARTIPQIPISEELDSPRVPGREIRVGVRHEVLVPILERGAVSLRVRPTAGRVLLRAMARADRERPSSHAPRELVARAAIEQHASPVTRPEEHFHGSLPEFALPRARLDIGTFSFEMGYFANDLGDVDVGIRQPAYGAVAVTHRLAIVPRRLWLRSRVERRVRLDMEPATGFRTQLEWTRLPLGLRIGATGGVDFMEKPDAWRLLGALRLSGIWGIGRNVAIAPRLAIAANHQSLERVGDPRSLDFDVWNSFRRDHWLAISSGVSGRWLAAQDTRVEADIGFWTNADLSSIDRVILTMGLSWVADVGVPRSLVTRLRYRPGYRFVDQHRPRDYVRHDLTAQFSFLPWLGPNARLVIELAANLYIEGDRVDASAFALVGLDLVLGRNLTDFSPTESAFSTLLGSEESVPEANR